MKLVQLGDRGLDERGQRNGFIHPHRNIANPEFQGAEEWVRPDIPPDFLRIIDAVGLDQQLDEVVVLAPTGKVIGNIRARKLVKNFATI